MALNEVQVSVIIPIYNGEADLPDLLAGLRSQTYPQSAVEYCLVDNGSCDRTLEQLKIAQFQFQELGWTLHVLSESNIQSSYAARNAGIRAASGEILIFTDADCRPQSDWVERMVQPFAEPQVGLVAGEIKALPGETWLEHHAEQQETLSQKHTLAHSFLPYGQTANLAVRRAAFQQAGLFRPYLTTGGDADLCWRVLQAGDWQIEFQSDAVVRHRHRSNLSDLLSQWRRYGRSNRYLHELHGVDLMRDLTQQEYLHSVGRWLLKELPKGLLKSVAGRATRADWLGTPVSLLCANVRSRGQQQAQLPENAAQIDWLEPSIQDVKTEPRPNKT